VWIQLRVARQVDINGRMKQFHPGDWVDIGKQTAIRWIAEGAAVSPQPINNLLPPGCGAVLWSENPQTRKQLETLSLPITVWGPDVLIPYSRTVFLGLPHLRPSILLIGLQLLDHWQAVAPLFSYDALAANLGTPDEQKITKALVHDLRVPVYEPRLFIVRRCRDMEALLKTYLDEQKRGPEPHLAFLRAVYRIKPQLCAAPVSWTERGV